MIDPELETAKLSDLILNDEIIVCDETSREYFSVCINDKADKSIVLRGADGKTSRWEYSEFEGMQISRKKRCWVVVSNVKGGMPGWSTKRFAADRAKTAGEWWTPNIDHAYIYHNIFMAKAYAKKLKFGEPEVFEIDQARKIDTKIEFR